MRLALPLLALFTVSLTRCVHAQTWTVLDPSPFNANRFEDAAFVTPERGWIVGGFGGGRIFETQDGGVSWTLRAQVAGYLRTVAFPSAALGWVGVLASDGPTLYETRDGGTTLTDVTSRITPAPSSFWGVCGLFALDEMHAFGVGEYDGPAVFIKTTDGGQTWQSRNLSSQIGSLIDVRFTDPMNGIIVGGSTGLASGGQAVILGTTDGGETWTERGRSSGGTGGAEWAWKISFPSEMVGYVSVEYLNSADDGKVLKTTDGGLTWTELSVPGGGSMQGVGFVTEDIGWTSGRGTDMVTTDGGRTWMATSGLDGRVNRFEFFGDTLGYAMGRRVHRLRRVSTGEQHEPLSRFELRVSPNPAANRVTLTYDLDTPTEAEVAVFDALGRQVALLHASRQRAGHQHLTWTPAAPGLYLARLSTPSGRVVRSFVVAR